MYLLSSKFVLINVVCKVARLFANGQAEKIPKYNCGHVYKIADLCSNVIWYCNAKKFEEI
jgi:hypothetical protein